MVKLDALEPKVINDLIRKHPKDPVLPLFLDYRGLKKLIGQYLDGYTPWKDGRIHTTFGRKPANLRYNSVQPNVQNITKTSKYAQKIRQLSLSSMLAETIRRVSQHESVISMFLD